jgi:hypothetical protein
VGDDLVVRVADDVEGVVAADRPGRELPARFDSVSSSVEMPTHKATA